MNKNLLADLEFIARTLLRIITILKRKKPGHPVALVLIPQKPMKRK